MGDAVPLILMVLALVAMMIARALLMAARDHVRRQHPAWFEALGGGQSFRLGGPDERARRRLVRPLILGPLPDPVADDTVLRRLGEHLRLALLTAVLSRAGLVVIIALRSQG
jgi:hypothetical protein